VTAQKAVMSRPAGVPESDLHCDALDAAAAATLGSFAVSLAFVGAVVLLRLRQLQSD
jgi:hypothetical protein